MDPSGLENILGYSFRSPELLSRALTHSSWANENPIAGSDEARCDNETFEFLGDSVLGLVVAEVLLELYPSASEGELTVMKHRLVSMETLADVARRLDLAGEVRISAGLERHRGRERPSLLSDTLEAVIGAMFLDGGYEVAQSFIRNAFADELTSASPGASSDFKSMLQEKLQAQKLPTPAYNILEVTGPPHDRHFRVEAVWEGGRTEGEGRSKKSAETDAARKALESIDVA